MEDVIKKFAVIRSVRRNVSSVKPNTESIVYGSYRTQNSYRHMLFVIYIFYLEKYSVLFNFGNFYIFVHKIIFHKLLLYIFFKFKYERICAIFCFSHKYFQKRKSKNFTSCFFCKCSYLISSCVYSSFPLFFCSSNFKISCIISEFSITKCRWSPI